ncbi:hypothetical protein CLAFUW4_10613 [Fulvia fulva]|uniref:Uncharacterized protein n=1 Tax=Passalora fulva TaxID=5499 RepID=A0A9Q8LF77_PASFU|nr:uncharacterized protein CLAFUR5_05226 [Fulvia fulva]KAK4615566.1 hypothetical protein CLAFUR4_10618 [Fulvia fulva]KAK4617333.1 hypothetical protein CLAFUR0_10626 [Fulvia fulva]UJO16342.1 hypothetical protein CLAFUR5_05226 [Fulvia fulva]WPV18970.1 hypothetical protein CLAFUW4_10613 [Fulvia fulva]WPV34535.1 hypothetical protein CLAFUW7_10615 [Fulvia fulva]
MTYYGNTKARILDFYITRDGKLARFSDSIPLEDVRAGYAYRAWLAEKQRRVQLYKAMLQQDDYTFANRATCLPAHVALSPYRKFPKLSDERKYASNYPPTKVTYSKAGFTDLPGELRNKIYILAGTAGHIFKLHTFLASDFCNGRPEAADLAREPLEQYRERVQQICPLMRVSKRLNAEVASMFFGENEFRFSRGLGWFFLESFLHGIGKVNVGRVRKIAVCDHWAAKDPRLVNSGRWYRDIVFVSRQRGMVGLKHNGVGDGGRDEAVQQCVRMLEEGGVLAELKLILPARFDVHNPFGLKFDGPKFQHGAPNIKLTHLAPQNHYWGPSPLKPETTETIHTLNYPARTPNSGSQIPHQAPRFSRIRQGSSLGIRGEVDGVQQESFRGRSWPHDVLSRTSSTTAV